MAQVFQALQSTQIPNAKALQFSARIPSQRQIFRWSNLKSQFVQQALLPLQVSRACRQGFHVTLRL
jgi:hypothetical protein